MLFTLSPRYAVYALRLDTWETTNSCDDETITTNIGRHSNLKCANMLCCYVQYFTGKFNESDQKIEMLLFH